MCPCGEAGRGPTRSTCMWLTCRGDAGCLLDLVTLALLAGSHILLHAPPDEACSEHPVFGLNARVCHIVDCLIRPACPPLVPRVMCCCTRHRREVYNSPLSSSLSRMDTRLPATCCCKSAGWLASSCSPACQVGQCCPL